jgi:Glycosyltransferase family 87
MPRRPVHWLLWSALAIHAPIALVCAARSSQPIYDFERYYDIATNPGRPYLDFPVEYPPGTVLTLRALATAAGGRARFGVGLVLVSVVADAIIVAALGWGWGVAAAACYALIVIPIVDLFFLRADLWSTALVAVAVAAWQRERRIVCGLSLAAGAALKLWPLAFFVLLLAPGRSRVRLMSMVAGAAAGTAILVGWMWMAGWSGFYQVLTFRGAHGWEIESTVGSVWMLVSRSSMRVESGAWRIGTTTGPVSMLLVALAAPPCLWAIWRGARTGHLGAGWIGGVSTLLALSAVLSPQYAAWLAPGCAIAWAQRDRRLAILAALAILLTNLVWKSFNPLLHGATGPLVMLLARNALVIITACDAAWLLALAPLAPMTPVIGPAPSGARV